MFITPASSTQRLSAFAPAASIRLSRPTKGRSLGATVVSFARPIREIIDVLCSACTPNLAQGELFAFLKSRECRGCISESANERISWFILNVAMLDAWQGGKSFANSICQSIDWFFGPYRALASDTKKAFDPMALLRADDLLRSVRIDSDLVALLPYVLEPHGHVTRGDLERLEGSAQKRNSKRHAGVYYTPSDVAEFMVRELVDNNDSTTWFDPACGTAVFLREVLIAHCRRQSSDSPLNFCQRSLFGADISPLATESATFVLMMECARGNQFGDSCPFDAWKSLAANLVPVNSMLLGAADTSPDLVGLPESQKGVSTREIFPGRDGFDRIIMNPPYSEISLDCLQTTKWKSFQRLKAGATGNAATAFVEMLWTFAKPGGAAAAVIPLSIAASTHSQYQECRKALYKRGGRWEFLFFDREPHALFGEDVKTRNAIVFWHDAADEVEFHTSRLLKWTSEYRPLIFTRERTTNLASSIENFVPKLGSEMEASLYEHLRRLPRTDYVSPRISRATWTELREIDDPNTIAIGSSAYNFLNVFPPAAIKHLSKDEPSASPLHLLTFTSLRQREIAFALLSSSVAFWLWHVEGDGFHVTAEFLRRLPLWHNSFFITESEELALLGQEAWQVAREKSLRSLNGGKVTYSFHSSYAADHVKAIDLRILSSTPHPAKYKVALDEFIHSVVSIDGSSRRRQS